VNISYLHQLYCLRSSSRFTWYKNRAPQFSHCSSSYFPSGNQTWLAGKTSIEFHDSSM
jgi:hypothetical protein